VADDDEQDGHVTMSPIVTAVYPSLPPQAEAHVVRVTSTTMLPREKGPITETRSLSSMREAREREREAQFVFLLKTTGELWNTGLCVRVPCVE